MKIGLICLILYSLYHLSLFEICYRKGLKAKKILVQENSIEPKFHHINDENVLNKTTPKSRFIKKARFRKGNLIDLFQNIKYYRNILMSPLHS